MNLKKYEELRKKAESGDAQAMLEYSEYLQKYHGLQEAHEWHTRAEEGNFILYGWVKGTLEDAFVYFRKASELGERKAFSALGDCFLYGWGCKQDFQKARECYKKASWWKHRKIIKMIDSEEFRKGIDGVTCKD